jgi:hypothetical protein
MEIAEIAPLLKADKITLTISAENNGQIRVTYADWDDAKVVPFWHRFELVWEGGERLALL